MGDPYCPYSLVYIILQLVELSFSVHEIMQTKHEINKKQLIGGWPPAIQGFVPVFQVQTRDSDKI